MVTVQAWRVLFDLFQPRAFDGLAASDAGVVRAARLVGKGFHSSFSSTNL